MNFPGPEIALSGPLGQELRSLDSESDPELYFRGLLDLGRRLTQRDDAPAALQVFQFILAKAERSAPDLAKQAQGEIDAIEGRGALGKRAEFLSQRLFREAANPSALLGMAGAQAVFSLARTTLLFRLAAAPSSLVSRGFGARALASTGAFAAEAPSFVAFTRAANAALGEKHGERSLAQEMGGSFLSLGALKLAGWAGSSLLPRHEFAAQASMFGGILLGHRLEELAQLRPVSDGATALLDSFATLFQFNLAGKILRGATGEGWMRFPQELQLRIEASGPRSGGDWSPGLRALALAQAGKLEPQKVSPLLIMSKAEEILASAPPSVKGLIEGLHRDPKEPDHRLFNLAVTFLLSKDRHSLTPAEKKFLLSVAEHQLAEFEKGLGSPYLPKLIYNAFHDFKGLERTVKLMPGRSYDKYTALMNLEKYDQAFESVDIGGFGGDIGTDIVFHKLAGPMFRRLSEMAQAQGYHLVIQPLSRTAMDLLDLSSSYDLIVAIAKGGLLSGMMAKFLNLPVKIVEIHAHNREVPSSKWVDDIQAEEIAGKRILLVDKDAVSGASIREAVRLLEPYRPREIGAYFNYEAGQVIPRETARNLSNEGVCLHFPGSARQASGADLYYFAHEKLGTPLGRFRKAYRELAKLKREESVQRFIDRQEKAFFSFNPFLPGVEEIRSSMASRLEVIARNYEDAKSFDEIRARRHLVELLRVTPTLPDYFAAELARGRYHARGLELAERRSVENSHIPHSYVAAFHSAQKAVKNKYDIALIVGPEGFAYEPIFRDLGMKTIAVNIPEADYGGKRSIEIFDHLAVLRGKRVLVVEDDVQSGATLAKLLEEIQPYEPRELGLYLGLPAGRQMEGNIPPAFKKVFVTGELGERENAAFLRHLKEREVVFKYPPPK